jgi:hypothetical protein
MIITRNDMKVIRLVGDYDFRGKDLKELHKLDLELSHSNTIVCIIIEREKGRFRLRLESKNRELETIIPTKRNLFESLNDLKKEVLNFTA